MTYGQVDDVSYLPPGESWKVAYLLVYAWFSTWYPAKLGFSNIYCNAHSDAQLAWTSSCHIPLAKPPSAFHGQHNPPCFCYRPWRVWDDTQGHAVFTEIAFRADEQKFDGRRCHALTTDVSPMAAVHKKSHIQITSRRRFIAQTNLNLHSINGACTWKVNSECFIFLDLYNNSFPPADNNNNNMSNKFQ